MNLLNASWIAKNMLHLASKIKMLSALKRIVNALTNKILIPALQAQIVWKSPKLLNALRPYARKYKLLKKIKQINMKKKMMMTLMK